MAVGRCLCHTCHLRGGQDIEVQRRRHLQLAEMEGLVTTLLVTGLSSDLPSSTYLSFITCQALL